jgi:hypothetical protein
MGVQVGPPSGPDGPMMMPPDDEPLPLGDPLPPLLVVAPELLGTAPPASKALSCSGFAQLAARPRPQKMAAKGTSAA